MGENSKTTRQAAGRGKTVDPATLSSPLQASRCIDPLTPAFIQWCQKERGFSSVAAASALKPVMALAAAYFDLVPDGDVTAFEVERFRRALDSTLDLAAPQGPETLEHAGESVRLFIEFLGGTRTWTGTEQDYNTIHGIFDDDQEHGINVPELTAEEQLEGFTATVLAQRLQAFLLWIGKGKEATATQTLRLKDIEGAAAAIGVAVRGATPAAAKAQGALFGDGEDMNSVRTAKTMNDEPKLSLFWEVLTAEGLIEFGPGAVRCSPLAEKVLAGDKNEKIAVLHDFTAQFLAATVHVADLWDAAKLRASLVKAAMLEASTTDTPPRADAPLGQDVLDWVDYMVELGVFSGGTHLRMPPALIGSVAVVLGGVVSFDGGPVIELERPAVEPHATEPAKPAKADKPNSTALIFQLKVAIQRASPPIWRRLLVRSDTTLGLLHEIIQASFDWEDSHLHEFNVGGRTGDNYGPPDPEGYGDPVLNEGRYTLGQVLAGEGAKMTYTYDFGDDWEHAITLEKILPADPQAAAVRCTAGRGAGPAEDCGGVWGWSAVIEGVNNPGHGEYEEYRDWLGLAPGEPFDPKKFDWKDFNEDLEYMF